MIASVALSELRSVGNERITELDQSLSSGFDGHPASDIDLT